MLGDFGEKQKRQKNKKRLLLHECGFSKLKARRTKKGIPNM